MQLARFQKNPDLVAAAIKWLNSDRTQLIISAVREFFCRPVNVPEKILKDKKDEAEYKAWLNDPMTLIVLSILKQNFCRPGAPAMASMNSSTADYCLGLYAGTWHLLDSLQALLSLEAGRAFGETKSSEYQIGVAQGMVGLLDDLESFMYTETPKEDDPESSFGAEENPDFLEARERLDASKTGDE